MAATLAHGQVKIVPSTPILEPGQTCTFRVLAEPGLVLDPEEAKAPDLGRWEWRIADGGAGTVDRDTGVFTAPPVDQATLIRVEAFNVFHAVGYGQGTVTVLPRAAAAETKAAASRPPARGLSLLAGRAAAGHQDGRGAEAAFSGVGGMIRWSNPGDPVQTFLVADTGNHVLRLVNTLGAVTTLCGKAGSPDWVDGFQSDARFNGPTHLASYQPHDSKAGSRILVADTGNHVIRLVAADGTVTTLAGAAGEAGHVDADRAQDARFNRPQGLAQAADGTVYVADQGNFAIRAIRPDGRVETLAGVPGGPGATDGLLEEARFTQLKAMLWEPEGDSLLFLDGHAVRGLKLQGDEDGAVVFTMLGEVETPSTPPDMNEGYVPEGAALSDPTGLALTEGVLYVADTGNHAIRTMIYRPGEDCVIQFETLVGRGPQPQTRSGWLAQDTPLSGEPGVASVKAPGTLLPTGGGTLLVATDTGLVSLRNPPAIFHQEFQRVSLTVTEPTGKEPCTVDFTVSCLGPDEEPADVPLTYWVDFYNPDGSLQHRARGGTRSFSQATVRGCFNQTGKGRVLVSCFDDEGTLYCNDANITIPLAHAEAFARPGVQVQPRVATLLPDGKLQLTARLLGSGWSSAREGQGGGTPGLSSETKVPMDRSSDEEEPEERFTWAAFDQTSGQSRPVGAAGLLSGAGGDLAREWVVRATSNRTGLASEARVLMLPESPFAGKGVGQLILEYLGGEAQAPFSEALPFQGLPRRNDPLVRVEAATRGWGQTGPWNGGTGGGLWFTASYGLPRSFEWSARADADGQHLTFQRTDGDARLDVSGKASQSLTLTHSTRLQLESLCRAGTPEHAWQSHVQQGFVNVIGVAPGMGHPGDARHGDGCGGGARFTRPAGMAALVDAGGRFRLLLLADPGDHTIRIQRPVFDERVGTLCGTPGTAGHQDGAGGAARFNGPTHLAVRYTGVAGDWVCLVADTGNHVIRQVRADGTVSTLAGQAGQAAFADGGQDARFNEPRGIVFDGQGNAYVADHGNFAIRRIDPAGTVTTVAGTAGVQGADDGVGGAARFWDLKALAYRPGEGDAADQLWILDGHAVRKLDLITMTVDTQMGIVDQAGFADGGQQSNKPQACLNDPSGLAFGNGLEVLLITDRGNHAIRQAVLHWSVSGEGVQLSTLSTLVGDPAHGETRYGLLRDGLPAPLDEGYATLVRPADLVEIQPDVFLVTTGSEVVKATFRGGYASARARGLGPIQATCSIPAVDQPCTVRCQVERRDHRFSIGQGAPPTLRVPVRFTVTFIDGDGHRQQARPVWGWSGERLEVQGTFSEAGAGRVLVTVVDHEGHSTHAVLAVEVLEKAQASLEPQILAGAMGLGGTAADRQPAAAASSGAGSKRKDAPASPLPNSKRARVSPPAGAGSGAASASGAGAAPGAVAAPGTGTGAATAPSPMDTSEN